MKLGSTDISKVYLGSTEVSKAYLGSVQVHGGTTPVLPYDAEVEYLQSSGTQYIDTGISPTTNTEVDIRLRYNSFVASSIMCGTRTGSTNNNRFFPFAHSSDGVVRCTYGTTQYTMNIFYKWTYDVVFNETSTHKCIVNGRVLGTLSGYTKSTSDNLILFGTSGYGDSHYLGSGNIYRCVIKENGTTVRDYIPVRKNGVGYLYDKVSGELYGNDGSGSFSYGPDKPSVYDAEVEYLEANGTQYFSSGILFTVGHKVYVDAIFTNNYDTIQIIAGPGGGGGMYVCNQATNSGSFGMGSSDSVIGRSNVRTSMVMTYSSGRTYLTGNGTTVNKGRDSDPTTYPINFFCGNKNYYSSAKIYACKITNSSDVVLVDFIPVRVGQVGYMYDKVSGNLFGNDGTGAFTYGNDVS